VVIMKGLQQAPPPASQPAPTTQPSTQPASGPTTQAVQPVPPIGVARPLLIRVAGLIARPVPDESDPVPAPSTLPATGPAVPSEKVAPLVTQLDADDFKTREAAQKALIDLGPGVVPVLQEMLKNAKSSLEVNTRIERVIRAFQPAPVPRRVPRVEMVDGLRAPKADDEQ